MFPAPEKMASLEQAMLRTIETPKWDGHHTTKRQPTSLTHWILISAITIYFIINYTTIQFWINIWKQMPGSFSDPDVGRDLFDLIKSRGFDYESHYIETKDGYQLQMVRLVYPFVDRKHLKRPLLLFHGYMCTGTVFLINNYGHLDEYGNYVEYDENNQVINGSQSVTNTLGFTLSANGYDVWLPNYRGSIYSPNHTQYSYDSPDYWRFSMDEMIYIDLPAMIDYVLDQTNHTTLGYIGYSQGSTLMLALMSISDHYARLVKPFIGLAPVWYNVNVTSWLAKFNFTTSYYRYNPQQTVLKDYRIYNRIIANLCSNRFIGIICGKVFDLAVGFNSDSIRFDRLPVYLYNVPAGASAWNSAQHAQTLEAGRQIEHFNYGYDHLNLEKYGQSHPPIYNVSMINSTDVALFYTVADKVNTLQANQMLIQDFRVPLLDDYLVDEPTWNHMNFVFGKTTGPVFNKRILDILSRYDDLLHNQTIC